MTKLERLAAACKCSVIVEASPHRDNYETPREYFERMESYDAVEEGPPPEEMSAAGAPLWWLQWYPRTPVGFNRLFGSNLDHMLDAALKDMGVTNATSATADR